MPSHVCEVDQPCAVPAHPDVLHRVAEHFESIQQPIAQVTGSPTERPLGLNDGVIFARGSYPPNVPAAVMSQGAQEQPKLRGAINVIVVLVNFKQKAMSKAAPQYFRDLFFSQKKIPSGSVTEYFAEVSNSKISITGDVVGPFELPQKVEFYANGGHGMKGPALEKGAPSLRTMANDTVSAVEAAGIDLKKYDNKGRADGYVDAFIIVHAGTGGEVTLKVNDLWSCKWVIPGDTPREVGKTKTRVYPFLTIPEDAKLGVCAHEIGHLVFGWPDLYDVSVNNSPGIGSWCLMSRGSWGRLGNAEKGTTPCHPSAWCKLDQGWVDSVVDEADDYIFLNDVKADVSNTRNANRFGYVHKLWSNGQAKTSKEYFLVENRTKSGYDSSLPGEGLLVWHIDDLVKENDSTKPHYKVALMNADGAPLSWDGDDTNPFPGRLGKREFSATTSPNSNSYAGQDTFVSVRNISNAGRTMRMSIVVTPQTNNPDRTSKL